MGMKFTVTDDNTQKVLQAHHKAVVKALTEMGLEMERNCKKACTVDTGLLRNSITYALDGDSPKQAEYQDKAGVQKGQYDGQAPAEQEKGLRAVFVGTNVYYAPYVEYGTSQKKGSLSFLRVGVEQSKDKFEEILKKNLSSEKA